MLRLYERTRRFLIDGVDPRQLWRRYALGLSIIVVLILLSHAASIWAISAAETDAAVINDSGRQRMLSQRILYLVVKSIDAEGMSSDRAKAAIDLFEASHSSLTSSETLSVDLQRLYFAGEDEPSLDSMVRQYILDARLITEGDAATPEVAAALSRMEAVGPGVLLEKLNEAVQLYEDEANARSDQLATLQHYSLLLALITIIVEALAIFLPAQIVSREALEKLEARNQELKSAREAEQSKSNQIQVLRDAAEHDALHDPLTGLANRRYLERELGRRASCAEEAERGLAVLHIDLDRFKQINDRLGHAAGDLVLTSVANALRETVREGDFVARVGGDEFVVVARSDGDKRPLEAMAARIIDRMRQPVQYEDQLCRFGASVGIDIGIAEATGRDIEVSRLLTNADMALYKAKELGRGRFCFFGEELRAETEKNRRLSDDISLALTRGEFFPVYQPQICAATGALYGVEALARWRHPMAGVLAPSAFIPISERMGVMGAIDERMLEAALEDLKKWDALGLNIPRLSVNVSTRRLRDPRLAHDLSQLEIPRGRLSFEIVEAVFADVIDDELQANLDLVAELGISVEVDDFGTGHASLASLVALAPSHIKIARELIAPLPASETHRALAKSVLEIAKALKIEVIAEGVESVAQDRILTELGCTALQGYCFAAPMDADALFDRIASGAPLRSNAQDAARALNAARA